MMERLKNKSCELHLDSISFRSIWVCVCNNYKSTLSVYILSLNYVPQSETDQNLAFIE